MRWVCGVPPWWVCSHVCRILRALVTTRSIPEALFCYAQSIENEVWRCHSCDPAHTTVPPRSDGQRSPPFTDEHRRRVHARRPVSARARRTRRTGDRERHTTAARCVVGFGNGQPGRHRSGGLVRPEDPRHRSKPFRVLSAGTTRPLVGAARPAHAWPQAASVPRAVRSVHERDCISTTQSARGERDHGPAAACGRDRGRA